MGRKRAPTRSGRGKIVKKAMPKKTFFAWIIIALMVLSVLAYVVLYQFDTPLTTRMQIGDYTFGQTEGYWEIVNTPRDRRDLREMMFFTLPYDYISYQQIADYLQMTSGISLSINPNLQEYDFEIYSGHEFLRSLLGETLFLVGITPYASISEEYLGLENPVINCESGVPVIVLVDRQFSNTSLVDGIYQTDDCIEIVASSPLEMARLIDALRFALIQ